MKKYLFMNNRASQFVFPFIMKTPYDVKSKKYSLEGMGTFICDDGFVMWLDMDSLTKSISNGFISMSEFVIGETPSVKEEKVIKKAPIKVDGNKKDKKGYEHPNKDDKKVIIEDAREVD